MKIIALIILSYTMYLNTQQTNLLKTAGASVNSEKVKSQLNMNIICSYVFTIFIGLLIIFVIKSFF
jgi:capsular polysaccharide biosynthesis protein